MMFLAKTGTKNEVASKETNVKDTGFFSLSPEKILQISADLLLFLFFVSLPLSHEF